MPGRYIGLLAASCIGVTFCFDTEVASTKHGDLAVLSAVLYVGDSLSYFSLKRGFHRTTKSVQSLGASSQGRQ